jgi:hypothetical protein
MTIIPEPELLPEMRDLLGEHSFIARKSPEAVCRALRVLRGIETTEFQVAVVLEALSVEGEVVA